MVGMVYQPCRTTGSKYEEAYTIWMAGEGLTYQARQREGVWCTDCWAELAAGYLKAHHQMQNRWGWGQESHWEEETPPSEDYRVYFTWTTGTVEFPVEGYRRGGTSRDKLWVHFLHRHMQDTIFIL